MRLYVFPVFCLGLGVCPTGPEGPQGAVGRSVAGIAAVAAGAVVGTFYRCGIGGWFARQFIDRRFSRQPGAGLARLGAGGEHRRAHVVGTGVCLGCLAVAGEHRDWGVVLPVGLAQPRPGRIVCLGDGADAAVDVRGGGAQGRAYQSAAGRQP
ncbi:hypothetical protein D3C78_1523720 [compost metagenome]